MSALAKIGLLSLRASGRALGAGDDVDYDLAVVLAAVGAGAVRDAQLPAFALRKAHAGDRVVATALGRLGTISTHSDYHMAGL